MEIEGVELEHDMIPDDGVRALIMTLKTKKRYDHEKMMSKIRKIEGVVHLEEL